MDFVFFILACWGAADLVMRGIKNGESVETEIDLGSGYKARWLPWSPDRSIPENFKRYHDVQDIEKCLLQIDCPHGTNGGIHPDTPEVRRVFPNALYWQVESWEPLTLSPSILMSPCGCHGFIREGKWVAA